MWLEALQGSRSSFKLPAKAIIGRSKSCDITLDDKRVSDRHCHVCISGAYVTVEDLSRNGTWVNGNR
jgi:pSer/pThr/pTyr-binding forkhead associated (FHA) protein